MCARKEEWVEASYCIRISLPRKTEGTAMNKGSRTRLFGSIPDAHLMDSVTWASIELVYTSVSYKTTTKKN